MPGSKMNRRAQAVPIQRAVALLRVEVRVLEAALARRGLKAKGVGGQRLVPARALFALSREVLRRLRAQARLLRIRPIGSKYWVAGYPRLVSEWHPTKNGDLFPDELSYGSNRRVWWQCRRHAEHVWRSAPKDRVRRDERCPFCSNHRLSVTNCLSTVAPKLASEWHPTRNGRLRPEGVIAGGKRQVWWQCRRWRNHVWRASVANRFVLGSGCPFCAGQRPTRDNSLGAVAPRLAKQWDRKRNAQLTPRDVTVGSRRRVWWRCRRGPDHVWQSRIHDRMRAPGCPFCVGRRLSVTNSLATLHPGLAAEWHPDRNGRRRPEQVLAGASRRVWWRCGKDPGHAWQTRLNSRSRELTGCPHCSWSRRPKSGSRAG